ncbi:MAG: hypothetical protein R3292_09205, partial [Alcanivorax sp.]|nr:hypothetical protein [Alcanivorax sp.]
MHLQLRQPPQTLLSVGLLYLLLLAMGSIFIAMQPPWLGVSLGKTAAGLTVTAISPDSPLAGRLLPGETLVGIHNGRERVPLDLALLRPEPDNASDYGAYQLLFRENARLYAMLTNGPVTLETGQHQLLQVTARSSRPFSALPPLFWYQMLCAIAVFGMGIGVVAFVQEDISARLYTSAALGLSLGMTTSAIYTTRELVMPPDLFQPLSYLNEFGAMLFASCGTAMLWYFPRPLGRFPLARAALCLMVLMLLLHYLQLIDNLDLTVRAP